MKLNTLVFSQLNVNLKYLTALYFELLVLTIASFSLTFKTISESEDLSSKISSLRDVTIKAGTLASVASDRIKDLARQLENLKKHCNLKDAPLCDTINTYSLELKMKFNLVNTTIYLESV